MTVSPKKSRLPLVLPLFLRHFPRWGGTRLLFYLEPLTMNHEPLYRCICWPVLGKMILKPQTLNLIPIQNFLQQFLSTGDDAGSAVMF